MQKFDVVVIGGGAAGLFCAIEAGKRRRRVLVIEHSAQVGRKILVSGGGRCNFTNIHTAPDNFISQNPHFAKSALARYTPRDFTELVKSHRIEFYEKKLGQLFCRESSRLIVEMLLRECEKARVEVRTGCTVRSIAKNDGFTLETSTGELTCENLVIATGGLSFPKVGATDFGYRAAKQFDIKRVETRPSLVPLIFAEAGGGGGYSALAGVSIDSLVSTGGGHEFRENILFTHRGLSGPAILQISNYTDKKSIVSIDLLPGTRSEELQDAAGASRKTVENFLGGFLPNRFAGIFAGSGLGSRPVAALSKKELGVLVDKIKNWQVIFGETEGYHKAEVTIGGVSTGELSSQTMESKRVPGLYFIGEVVDVTGWLGGYNFQWAWASAHAAGSSV
jgi:predicted Rossmann fold flavoprotein